MTPNKTKKDRVLINRERLMTYKKCPVCGKPFVLGEFVVRAFDTLTNKDTLVHSEESMFNVELNCYVIKY